MTAATHDKQSPNRATWLVLSYLWIAACCVPLPLLPFMLEKEDGVVRWHAGHGVAMGVAFLALSVVLLGAGWLLGMAADALRAIFYLLWSLSWVGFVTIAIIALLKALQGERWTLKPFQIIMRRLKLGEANAPQGPGAARVGVAPDQGEDSGPGRQS